MCNKMNESHKHNVDRNKKKIFSKDSNKMLKDLEGYF